MNIKKNYVLDNLSGGAFGLAMAAAALASPAAADDDYIDLTTAQLEDDGSLTIEGADADGTSSTVNIFNTIMSKGRIILSGVTGVLAIVMVGLFTWKAFSLAKSSDSPQERARCIQSMIFYFIGAACFGAASLFAGLFYNIFN